MPSHNNDISSFVVGVTGGIGSGKTTVSNRFNHRFDVPVIDADVVAREVVEPGQEALSELVQIFGPDVLDYSGALDRPHLKRLVFADPAQRKKLEAVLHPRIRTRMREHLAAQTAPYCLLGIPLLAEGGERHDLIDRVLVVDCPESLQIQRVVARDGLTEREVALIMQSQATREQRLAIADDVIINDGDNKALDKNVEDLHQLYSRLALEADGNA